MDTSSNMVANLHTEIEKDLKDGMKIYYITERGVNCENKKSIRILNIDGESYQLM